MAESGLRFYLVRHGVTAWNREMRMQGHTDIPLDEEGLQQAALIGARFAGEPRPPQAVWSSDLLRARQTAEAIAAPLGLAVQTTELLRETKLGEWEGLTRDEIQARGDAVQLANYLRDSLRYRPPGGETLEAAWERMLEAMALIRGEHKQGEVAIVGHGGSLRVLLCDALEAPISSMQRLWLDNTSVSILEEWGDNPNRRRRVLTVNDTSHLRCGT